MIRAPAASVTEVRAAPAPARPPSPCTAPRTCSTRTGAGTRAASSSSRPTPLLVAYTEGVLPSLGEEGQVAIRAVGSPRRRRARPTTYDEPAVARIKGSLADAAGAAQGGPRGAGAAAAPGVPRRRTGRPAVVRRRGGYRRLRGRAVRARSVRPPACAWSPSARRLELDADELRPHPADRARRHRPGQPAAPARPQAAAGRPVDASPARPRPLHRPGAGRRAALVLRRGRLHRGRLHRLPGRLVARAHPARGARRDGRREAARPLGAPGPQPAARCAGSPAR